MAICSQFASLLLRYTDMYVALFFHHKLHKSILNQDVLKLSTTGFISDTNTYNKNCPCYPSLIMNNRPIKIPESPHLLDHRRRHPPRPFHQNPQSSPQWRITQPRYHMAIMWWSHDHYTSGMTSSLKYSALVKSASSASITSCTKHFHNVHNYTIVTTHSHNLHLLHHRHHLAVELHNKSKLSETE